MLGSIFNSGNFSQNFITFFLAGLLHLIRVLSKIEIMTFNLFKMVDPRWRIAPPVLSLIIKNIEVIIGSR